MCAKWRNGYEPQLILDKVRPLVSLDMKGNVVFGGLDYHLKYGPILVSAVDFCLDIPEIQKETLVTTGIQEAVKKGILTPDGVKQAISRAERDFLNRKTSNFVLVTSISFRKMPPFRKVIITGQTIAFSKSLPRQFDRTSAERRFLQLSTTAVPTDYTAVRVACSGRTQTEAAEKALAALALLMGIWNFLLTRISVSFSLTDSGTGPIAGLRLGPMHTLHHPNGQIATAAIWYEPTYMQPAPEVDYSDKFEKLRKSERWILKQISKAKDGERLRNAFMRYASAVDEPRLETAFLRFWSLLEHLTDPPRGSYDKTIQRTAFTYNDPSIARQELQHLRDVRNGLVHHGASSTDPQAHVYQIKRYVDDLMLFFLRERNITKSRDEINEFLDLPPDADELERKCSLFKRAITFRSPKGGRK